MSAPITARHPACDGAGCAACLWTGSPVDASALLACPTCRREWRACACVDEAPSDDALLDVAAGYVRDEAAERAAMKTNGAAKAAKE